MSRQLGTTGLIFVLQQNQLIEAELNTVGSANIFIIDNFQIIKGGILMEVSLLSILALGFVLGIKHAIEPDHVIAVSTIASQSKKLWRSSLAGVFWGRSYGNPIYYGDNPYCYEG